MALILLETFQYQFNLFDIPHEKKQNEEDAQYEEAAVYAGLIELAYSGEEIAKYVESEWLKTPWYVRVFRQNPANAKALIENKLTKLSAFLEEEDDSIKRTELRELVEFYKKSFNMEIPNVVLPVEHISSIVPQYKVTTDTGKVYYLDFAIFYQDYFGNPCCIDLECDGHDYHERTPEQASHDKERDRELQKLGWFVARYTGRDILNRKDEIKKDIRRYIERTIPKRIDFSESVLNIANKCLDEFQSILLETLPHEHGKDVVRETTNQSYIYRLLRQLSQMEGWLVTAWPSCQGWTRWSEYAGVYFLEDGVNRQHCLWCSIPSDTFDVDEGNFLKKIPPMGLLTGPIQRIRFVSFDTRRELSALIIEFEHSTSTSPEVLASFLAKRNSYNSKYWWREVEVELHEPDPYVELQDSFIIVNGDFRYRFSEERNITEPGETTWVRPLVWDGVFVIYPKFSFWNIQLRGRVYRAEKLILDMFDEPEAEILNALNNIDKWLLVEG